MRYNKKSKVKLVIYRYLLLASLFALFGCFEGTNIYKIPDSSFPREMTIIYQDDAEKILADQKGRLLIDFTKGQEVFISNNLEDLADGKRTVFQINEKVFTTEEFEKRFNIKVTENATLDKMGDSVYIKALKIYIEED